MEVCSHSGCEYGTLILTRQSDRIRRFPGMTEYTLQARIELISNVSVEKKAWSRPPIQMEFQVPMFAASGLQIRYLRVIERSGYNAVKVSACIF